MAVMFAAAIAAFGSISLCLAANHSENGVQRTVLTPPVLKLNNHITQSVLGSAETHSSSVQKTPCTCGVFLSGQIVKGINKQPIGYAALVHEQDEPNACNAMGVKSCTTKCLETVAKHLPNSPSIICGSIDRDVHKERAHLFVKNCNDSWINTRLSTGNEYCCKDGHNYKCPAVK